MPRHHAPHTPNVRPILFARNENIAHVMPRVAVHALTSCAHHAARACRQAGHPNYTWRQELLMDVLFAKAELYLSKITASHFNVLNTKIRTCWKGFSLPCSMRTRLFQMRISGIEVRNPYRPCTTGRLHLASWGEATTKISLVLVHFGLIKLKPNQDTIVFPTFFTC